VVFGERVFDADAEKWELSQSFDWTMYATLDPLAMVLLDEVERVASKDDVILDFCCNVGRHLNEMARRGFTNLRGVDVMRSAILEAKAHFPALQNVDMVQSNVVDFFRGLEDDSVDWIYAHSATVELIHPAFDFAAEFARCARKGVIMLLDENGHKYPRFYRWKFRRAGLAVEKRTRVSDRLALLTLSK